MKKIIKKKLFLINITAPIVVIIKILIDKFLGINIFLDIIEYPCITLCCSIIIAIFGKVVSLFIEKILDDNEYF